jgi:hypothetical protein
VSHCCSAGGYRWTKVQELVDKAIEPIPGHLFEIALTVGVEAGVLSRALHCEAHESPLA